MGGEWGGRHENCRGENGRGGGRVGVAFIVDLVGGGGKIEWVKRRGYVLFVVIADNESILLVWTERGKAAVRTAGSIIIMTRGKRRDGRRGRGESKSRGITRKEEGGKCNTSTTTKVEHHDRD